VPFRDLVKAAMFAAPAHAAQRVARVVAEPGQEVARGRAVAGADDAIRLGSRSSGENKIDFRGSSQYSSGPGMKMH
jgi:uncharacterized membrane protein